MSRACRAGLLLLGLLGSCAGPAEFLRRPKEPVTWPPGAEQARIELMLAYRGSEDVERHPGFFASLLELVAGAEEVALVSPTGLAFGQKQTLWIADPGNSAVHRLSMDSGDHDVFTGSDEEPFETPVGVAVVGDGRIFVTDSSRCRIFVLSPSGDHLMTFGAPEEVGRPTGIAYDPGRERILVTDTLGCRVLAYDLQGEHLDSSGKRGSEPGQFNYPTNVAVMHDGRVVVTDSMNFRVQILTAQLEPVRSFGEVGRGPGNFASPKGIAVDSEDHIYVVDAMFDNVQIFDDQGRLLMPFGARGSELGQLYLPSGIHIDDKDRIFVADAGNARFQLFQYLRRKP